jgi:outer membrane receptor protein involved in Fe transport
VREWRAEPFISDVWTLRPDLKLEAGLVVEFSKLRVSGDGDDTRNFRFLKPRAILTYDLDPKTKFKLRAEREAAQLDFFDFATSVELGEDRVNAGNPDLVPERLWTFEAGLEKRLGEKMAFSISGFYARVTDTQDLVPFQGFAAPGNIGSSKRWGGDASITLPLSDITKSPWLSGVELKWTTNWRDSRVNDPVTLQKRRKSNQQKFFHEVNFRHDFSDIGWTYGADIYMGSGSSQYFLDEIQTFKTGTEVFGYIEYKKFPLGTLQLQIRNLTSANYDRFRTLYEPTRAGPVATEIRRLRHNDRRFLLTLSGKF